MKEPKFGELVKREEIPRAGHAGGAPPSEFSLQVLARLQDGLVLPVEFADPKAARIAVNSAHDQRSFLKQQGIRAAQRGTTVYFWKES